MNLRPPVNAINKSQNTQGIQSVVVDRQGQYQTELFLVPIEVKEIKQHIHPGIDSFEYHIAGDYDFVVEGFAHPNLVKGEPVGARSILGQVDATHWHGGTFTHGGAFLSFQYWLNGVEPTSVSDSFTEQSLPQL